MKTEILNKRALNIINKALEYGLEINENKTFEEIRIESEEILTDYAPHTEEEADIIKENIFYSDGKGYEINISGDFYSMRDIELMRQRGDRYLVLFTVIDSNANVIDLIKTFDD